MVHGDDFIIVAKKSGREKTLKLLEEHFELKHQTAGPADGMGRELRVLGRIAVCHTWRWSLEADPCLIEAAVAKLGLEEAKGIATPGHKPEAPAGAGCDVRSRRLDPRPIQDPDAAWPGFDKSPGLEPDALKRYQ